MQYALFSLLAAINFYGASIDDAPFLYRADMRNVVQSSSLGLSATRPNFKNFMMSDSPHQRFFYSVFTINDDVTGFELGYHPPLETKNFRLGLSVGMAKPQGRGVNFKYPVGGFKVETGWGPSLHYVRTHNENLYFITYRFVGWENRR